MSAPDTLVALRAGLAIGVAALLTPALWSPGAALGLFALGVATDVADGAIARRHGGGTRLGTLIDPLADKLLAFAVLVPLVGASHPALVALLVGREATVAALRLHAYARGANLPAGRLAKLKTALVDAACLLLLAGVAFAPAIVPAAQLLLGLAVLVSFLTLPGYVTRPRHARA